MIKIVCISDTHRYHDNITEKLPEANLLLFAGDMCGRGMLNEAEDFGIWLQSISHRYDKIFAIAGNHDWCFERSPAQAKQYLETTPNISYLRDQEVVYDGIKIYGSPWQPEFCNWAFNVPRGPKLEEIWSKIPDDTDILITHGPVDGILDFTHYDKIHVGCVDLAKKVEAVKPKIHLFGHIHEGYGYVEKDGTHFVNASICTLQYRPINDPFVFEMDADTKEVLRVL